MMSVGDERHDVPSVWTASMRAFSNSYFLRPQINVFDLVQLLGQREYVISPK